MIITQYLWANSKWSPTLSEDPNADWVLAFGHIMDGSLRDAVANTFPNAVICGCSTSGEIAGEEVHENSLAITSISFQKNTQVRAAIEAIASTEDSKLIGQTLAKTLLDKNLAHVFILSEGLNVNGSELVEGFNNILPQHVMVTGGLSGDADRFEKTMQWCNDEFNSNRVIAIGLYGNEIHIGHGSLGGWDPFGPDREVTKSQKNVLYELDNQSALELYKNYLGDYASDLPSAGLLFPLSIRGEGVPADGLVRTILAVDEHEQSVTFAGDIPQGCYARLMKANFDHLVDGAQQAAENCLETMRASNPELAILISCVGRKMVLKQRIEEEVESVRSVLGDKPCLTGFYSYGEISPLLPAARCVLHNQTMTITTLSEY